MTHIYPIVTTPALAECRDFYVRNFKARVRFESDWYIHLAVGRFELGLLGPNPPTRLPLFQHSTPTRGLCLAVEVENVRALYHRFQDHELEVLAPLHTYPGGELAFSVVDPAGTVLNVLERGHEDDERTVET